MSSLDLTGSDNLTVTDTASHLGEQEAAHALRLDLLPLKEQVHRAVDAHADLTDVANLATHETVRMKKPT